MIRGRTGAAQARSKSKILGIHEHFNPKRLVLESWQLSVFKVEELKGLTEPSRSSTHFTDGKTEALGAADGTGPSVGPSLWTESPLSCPHHSLKIQIEMHVLPHACHACPQRPGVQ